MGRSVDLRNCDLDRLAFKQFLNFIWFILDIFQRDFFLDSWLDEFRLKLNVIIDSILDDELYLLLFKAIILRSG